VRPLVRQLIERQLGASVCHAQALGGGCIADATRVELADGRSVVLKAMEPRPQPGDLRPSTLMDEAFMLNRLRQSKTVPVPDVLYADRQFLILDFIDNDGTGFQASAQESLADHIAAMHAVTVPRFGFESPTPVGPLQRPNDWSEDWVSFLVDNRLLFLGRLADGAGKLPPGCFGRLEVLCAKLDRWIPRTGSGACASLIHGDLWSGNVLYRSGALAGLIDPAVYFADPEIELAFMTLFGGIGDAFFDRYAEHRPIDPLFFEERRALYHLEPLLAHAWFFGGGYGSRADEILKRFVGN